MELRKVEDYREVGSLMWGFRKEKGKVVSNILPKDPVRIKAAEQGRLRIAEGENETFVIEDKGDFKSVSFFASEGSNVIGAMSRLREGLGDNAPWVLEHVIRAGKDKSLGEPTAVLRRMSHQHFLPESPENPLKLPYPYIIRPANEQDIWDIEDIFKEQFNALMERIPDQEELRELIRKEGIRLAFCNGKLAGFIIFQKEGQNLHLRYWWTAPGFRGGGIGSGLMREFIKASNGTMRQFLWVFSDNENAIKRYKHYGFEFDGTEDEIYIR